jgi:hypothetical protein
MVKMVLASDPACDWIVTGGDDTEPDPSHSAPEIAAQCTAHFLGTFGVMQPTGDRFAKGCIDKVCGSPWMGRAFCERVNGGHGPLWAQYTHMFVDEELQNVALQLGVLWQRRDLIHYHWHFAREGDRDNYARPRPAFLDEPQSARHWRKYERLFLARQAAGFPGHEPLATGAEPADSAPYLIELVDDDPADIKEEARSRVLEWFRNRVGW